MKFGGNKNDPFEPIGPQGFPMQLPNDQLGPGYSPGTIRNTLGSGLKAKGIFQKDGQIQNTRGGFIGPKQQPLAGAPMAWQVPSPMQGPGGYQPQQGAYNSQGRYNQAGYPQGQSSMMPQGNFPPAGYGMAQPRQLILQPAQEGISGNGIATISPDNSFILVVNLPPPQTFLGQGQSGVYAAYLVDEKGKTGFLAGILRSVGNGVYRAHFQSQVPLHHYSKVSVSLENPAQLGQVPNGPIILKVKEPRGMMSFLNPMRKSASTVWGKFTGLFGGKQTPVGPEMAPVNQEIMQPLTQMSVPPDTLAAPMAAEIPVPPVAPVPPVPPIPPFSPGSS